MSSTSNIVPPVGPDNRGDPKILQKPLLVLNGVKKGSPQTLHVTIQSPQNVSLTWGAKIENEASPGGWLQLGQISSPIAKNSSVTLNLTVITDKLTPGKTYTATLAITSNYVNEQAPISVTIV